MYTPAAFRQHDLDTLVSFVEQHGFGTLIAAGSPPLAAHLPMLIERIDGGRLRIVGHLAAANELAQRLEGERLLAIFQGPHTYVSPSLYGVQNSVPTWNYISVHITGQVRRIDDHATLRSIVERTTRQFESERAAPWSLESVDDAFVDKLLAAIVGFEIDVERIEGQWKLSQNHSRERRERVITGLRDQGDPHALSIANLMEQALHTVD